MTIELAEKDVGMLTDIIRFVDEKYDDPDEADWIPYAVFKSILTRNLPLTDKQRQWVKDIHEKIFEKPQYENLVSRGLVPRGKEVPTPPVLRNLPLKPPRRARKEDE